MRKPCPVPPPGWGCTRDHGHKGPCAAVPIVMDAEYEAPYTDLDAANRRITILTTSIRYLRAQLDGPHS